VKFDIYTRTDGAYVLIPEGSAVLREIESLYGELTFCETIDERDYPIAAIWQTVHGALERTSHAVLAEAIGRRLLGLDCEDDAVEPERREARA
jgi:hypothetical protein